MMVANSLCFIVPSGVFICWHMCAMQAPILRIVRRTSRNSRRCLSMCRRLALNVPGQWPWSRSPVAWLRAAQRRRAADAWSASDSQRRKAR